MDRKRIITPSKGGRDCRPPSARITQETLRQIDEILQSRRTLIKYSGIGKLPRRRRFSFADWLTEQAAKEHKRITKQQTSEAKQ